MKDCRTDEMGARIVHCQASLILALSSAQFDQARLSLKQLYAGQEKPKRLAAMNAYISGCKLQEDGMVSQSVSKFEEVCAMLEPTNQFEHVVKFESLCRSAQYFLDDSMGDKAKTLAMQALELPYDRCNRQYYLKERMCKRLAESILARFYAMEGAVYRAKFFVESIEGSTRRFGPLNSRIYENLAETQLILGNKPRALRFFNHALDSVAGCDIGDGGRVDKIRKKILMVRAQLAGKPLEVQSLAGVK